MHNFLRALLVVNGIYDVACACSILFFPVPLLSSLHSDMFADDEHRTHPVVRRLLAYWILTYGSVRLAVGMQSEGSILVASLTYFAEAFCFAHEHFAGGTLVLSSAAFVSLSSASAAVLYNPFIIARTAL